MTEQEIETISYVEDVRVPLKEEDRKTQGEYYINIAPPRRF